jgi:ADP-ribose pyrophosphatase YjhB (NUDIX family)
MGNLDDQVVPELRRSAVRVVLADSANQILLLHVVEPRHPEQGDCWELPGGGLDPGEDVITAAQREIAEETGLHVPAANIAAPRWFRSVAFLHAGIRCVQHEAIALATVLVQAPRVEATALVSMRMRSTSGTGGGQSTTLRGAAPVSSRPPFPVCFGGSFPAIASRSRSRSSPNDGLVPEVPCSGRLRPLHKGAGGTHKPGQEAKDVNNGRACNPQPWVTLLCPTCPRPSNASPSPAVARHGSPTKTAD